MKTRLGKIMIGTAVGAGALGVGFGGSMAVASATTSHSATTTSSTTSTTGTTAIKGVSDDAATPSPSASSKATHNCPNMKNGQDRPNAPTSTNTGS